MRRVLTALISCLMIAACRDNTVVLSGAAGSLAYSCSNPQPYALDSVGLAVLRHYLERFVESLAERRDFSQKGLLASALELEDWGSLQMLVVSDACLNGPLQYAGPRFPEPGTEAPAFELPRLDGQGQASLRESRGRYAIVNFWATWCLPCIAEYPELVRISLHHDTLVVVYHILHEDRLTAAREHLRSVENGRVINLADPDGRVAAAYGVYGLPTTYILDRDGRVLPACPTCRHRHLTVADFVAQLEQSPFR